MAAQTVRLIERHGVDLTGTADPACPEPEMPLAHDADVPDEELVVEKGLRECLPPRTARPDSIRVNEAYPLVT